MGERTFRIVGAPPTLSDRDRGEVAREVVRLRALVASAPGPPLVRVRRNPSGPLGEYVALLLEATALGVPRQAILPLLVRLRYRHRPWFVVGAEVVTHFAAHYGK